MKFKVFLVTLVLCSSIFANDRCGTAFLSTITVKKGGITSSYYNSIKKIIEKKGYKVINQPGEKIEDLSESFDYYISVNYRTNSSDLFSGRSYSATVFDSSSIFNRGYLLDKDILDESKVIYRKFIPFPRTKRWLVKVADSLKNCNDI